MNKCITTLVFAAFDRKSKQPKFIFPYTILIIINYRSDNNKNE